MANANLLLIRTSVLLPVPFLALGPVLGGSWALVALIYLSIFAFLADEALIANTDVGYNHSKFDTHLADVVPVLLGITHFMLLPQAILAISTGGFGIGEKLLIFLSFALFFGTISTANAHELIHRPDHLRHSLGRWVFISLLFGHHTSAHLAIHHRHVATPLDPNSAPLNQGFYRFFNQAWIGSFRSGLAIENVRLNKLAHPGIHPSNPYVAYFAGAFVFLALAYVLAGKAGVATYIAFATLAQIQLLLSDYVQHYGLRREIQPDGKYEPVTIQHSWNAPHVFSTALMLNAPRHSDHHAHPSIRYSELRTRATEGAPVLPYSLPVMSCIALYPRAWRKLMNPKVADWERRQIGAHRKSDPTISDNPV